MLSRVAARVGRAAAVGVAPSRTACAGRTMATTCAYDWEDPLNYTSLLSDEEVMIRVRVHGAA